MHYKQILIVCICLPYLPLSTCLWYLTEKYGSSKEPDKMFSAERFWYDQDAQKYRYQITCSMYRSNGLRIENFGFYIYDKWSHGNTGTSLCLHCHVDTSTTSTECGVDPKAQDKQGCQRIVNYIGSWRTSRFDEGSVLTMHIDLSGMDFALLRQKLFTCSATHSRRGSDKLYTEHPYPPKYMTPSLYGLSLNTSNWVHILIIIIGSFVALQILGTIGRLMSKSKKAYLKTLSK